MPISEAHCTKVSSHAAQCLSVIAPYAGYNANRVIVRNWQTDKNLNITLQDQALEEKSATLNGDFEKFIANTNAANDNEWRVVA